VFPQEDEAIEEIKEGLGDDVFEQVIETYQEVLLKEEVLASPKPARTVRRTEKLYKQFFQFLKRKQQKLVLSYSVNF